LVHSGVPVGVVAHQGFGERGGGFLYASAKIVTVLEIELRLAALFHRDAGGYAAQSASRRPFADPSQKFLNSHLPKWEFTFATRQVIRPRLLVTCCSGHIDQGIWRGLGCQRDDGDEAMNQNKRIVVVGRRLAHLDRITRLLEGAGYIVTSTTDDGVAIDMVSNSTYAALLIGGEVSQADRLHIITEARNHSASMAVLTINSPQSVLTQLSQAVLPG